MSYASKVQKKAIPPSKHKLLTPRRWIIFYDKELGEDVIGICTSKALPETKELPARVNCVVLERLNFLQENWFAPLDQIKVLGDKVEYSGPGLFSDQTGPIA